MDAPITAIILLVAVVVIGVMAFGLTSAVVGYQESLVQEQHEADQLTAELELLAGPIVGTSSTGYNVTVLPYFYSQQYPSQVYLVAGVTNVSPYVLLFLSPSSSLPPSSVYVQGENIVNEQSAYKLLSSIYSVSGRQLNSEDVKAYVDSPSSPQSKGVPITFHFSTPGDYVVFWVVAEVGANYYLIGTYAESNSSSLIQVS
ncbi:hypothetical protein [Sulfodiicoccus acidiphilus]|uniref:hypothetical protein n=1 Tax=Sulfodiicoccus acidiphilus TaxID=1670455 RepID=UPI000F8232BE|nr:hypothetical protein [Sulfodiicoccus acidiphilus]